MVALTYEPFEGGISLAELREITSLAVGSFNLAAQASEHTWLVACQDAVMLDQMSRSICVGGHSVGINTDGKISTAVRRPPSVQLCLSVHLKSTAAEDRGFLCADGCRVPREAELRRCRTRCRTQCAEGCT